MKDFFIVMKFTMSDMIKRKSFIISTVIILLFIIIGFNVPNIIKDIKGNDSSDKILIVDEDNLFNGALEAIKSNNIQNDFTIKSEKVSIDEIKEEINNDQYGEAIIISKDTSNSSNSLNLIYLVKNISIGSSVPEEYISEINSIYTKVQISKLGLSEQQINRITPQINVSMQQSDNQEVTGNIFTMLILSIVLFYAIYFCAYQVSASITTEKTSKIMETLVTSTTPRTIILGKTVGIGIVGLLQTCLLGIVAFICANSFLDKELLSSILDMSKITPILGLIIIIYFILGYLEYALIYALTGSTVSKPEDIQSANAPVAMITVVGFYLAYFTMMNPTSNLNVFASMLPISSPFCMPFRVMMGLSGIKEVIISIIILIITNLIIAKITIKIYSSAILNYGTRMTLKDMIKIYKDKNQN